MLSTGNTRFVQSLYLAAYMDLEAGYDRLSKTATYKKKIHVL